MSNRFHTHTMSSPRDISPEEINSLLNPNNEGVSHSNEWDAETAEKQSKKDILIARRESIRSAHKTDFTEEATK